FIYFSSYLTTTQFLTLSLHDALPIFQYLDFRSGQIGLSIFFIFLYSPKDTTVASFGDVPFQGEHKIGELLVRYQVIGCSFGSCLDRKSTRLNSSHVKISDAVFCLKKK